MQLLFLRLALVDVEHRDDLAGRRIGRIDRARGDQRPERPAIDAAQPHLQRRGLGQPEQPLAMNIEVSGLREQRGQRLALRLGGVARIGTHAIDAAKQQYGLGVAANHAATGHVQHTDRGGVEHHIELEQRAAQRLALPLHLGDVLKGVDGLGMTAVSRQHLACLHQAPDRFAIKAEQHDLGTGRLAGAHHGQAGDLVRQPVVAVRGQLPQRHADDLLVVITEQPRELAVGQQDAAPGGLGHADRHGLQQRALVGEQRLQVLLGDAPLGDVLHHQQVIARAIVGPLPGAQRQAAPHEVAGAVAEHAVGLHGGAGAFPQLRMQPVDHVALACLQEPRRRLANQLDGIAAQETARRGVGLGHGEIGGQQQVRHRTFLEDALKLPGSGGELLLVALATRNVARQQENELPSAAFDPLQHHVDRKLGAVAAAQPAFALPGAAGTEAGQQHLVVRGVGLRIDLVDTLAQQLLALAAEPLQHTVVGVDDAQSAIDLQQHLASGIERAPQRVE